MSKEEDKTPNPKLQMPNKFQIQNFKQIVLNLII
jgi:hypothetical protein